VSKVTLDRSIHSLHLVSYRLHPCSVFHHAAVPLNKATMSLFVATRASFKRPRTSLRQPHMYHNHIRCTYQIQMISYHRQRFTPWQCLRWNTSLSDENNESFRGILNHVQFFTLPLRRQSNMPILEIKTRQRHPNQKPKRPRKQNLAQIKQQLSNRLSFFFSDVNLRHDT